MHNNISEIKIRDTLSSSDQLPLSVVLRHDGDITNDIVNRDNGGLPYSHDQTCNWHKTTPEDISRHEHSTKTFICNIGISLEAFSVLIADVNLFNIETTLTICMYTGPVGLPYRHIGVKNTPRSDALVTSLTHKDVTAFWKSIGSMSDTVYYCQHPLTVSQVQRKLVKCGVNTTVEFWTASRKGHVQSLLNSIDSTDQFIITPNDIAMAIRAPKRGKSVGFDLLTSKHYIHSDHMLKVFLALLHTSFITHGHLPVNIIKTIIVPLIKSKTGDASDKNN